MKLENQVCSLPLAQRLKELGVPQGKSAFVWAGDEESGFIVALRKDAPSYRGVTHYDAPTVAELGEMLPDQCHTTWVHSVGWYYNESPSKWDKALCRFAERTEAAARAKMLIYLLENNLITL